MNKTTCLVTGATDGIGLETAVSLATRGANVIIHGRNRTKGRRALEIISERSLSNKLRYIHADFSSLDEVRAMAQELNDSVDKIDVLVNNAGAASASTRQYSQDGYELTFAVNHLAPFLLTNLLLDKLKAAEAARVVNVSSVAHSFKPLFDIDDLMSEKVKPLHAYGRSKFANILFSNELARRVKADGITSNAVHPGTIRSNFGKEAAVTRIFYRFAGPMLKTPEQGAETVIYLASSPAVARKTGGYYIDCELDFPDIHARDVRLAKKLWQASEQLVGLSD